MRKLILEAQMSVDGFMADPTGRTDWQLWKWDTNWNWDDELKKYFNNIMDNVDCILLSRKMAKEGFIEHWAQAAINPTDPRFAYAKRINETHKVVFSKTMDKTEWDNIDLAKGDLAEEVNKLKQQNGKDIIVYGGVEFVANLIKENLIDEYQLFVNPVAIGEGLKYFQSKTNFEIVKTLQFSCGMNVLVYKPAAK